MQIYLHQETNHPVFSLQNQLLSQTKTEKNVQKKKITQTLNGTQCSTSGPFSRHPVLFFSAHFNEMGGVMIRLL